VENAEKGKEEVRLIIEKVKVWVLGRFSNNVNYNKKEIES